MSRQWACIDGNEAAVRIAYRLSEVAAIYPITPASPMGELADDWASAEHTNLWGSVVDVVEMQSEAGAAGALHGALQKGALATTFTSSQGLLLMIPNMFKIAGELTPCVMHVAARTIATHALSIFGDHSDVMHARTTGWAMLSAGSVQEAHDFALVAHAATLRTRVPFVHFFDGFRTSHEVDKVELLDDDDLLALVREDDLLAFRSRGMSPERPVVRGTAQNPDVFFQAREASNPFHDAVPAVVQEVFDELADRTGRRYSLVEYHGAPDAERVVVVMGSGAGAVAECVDALVAQGERVGMVTVRLYRPFPAEALHAGPAAVVHPHRRARPHQGAGRRRRAALPRRARRHRRGHGGRRAAVRGGAPRHRWSLRPVVEGLHPADGRRPCSPSWPRPDPAGSSPSASSTTSPTSAWPRSSIDVARPPGEVQALFFGLGSDGTVGANKSSVKIIGEGTDLFAQGYFVYDSKKSGSVTVSHLRFGPDPIRSTYLIEGADFVACHQFGLLDKMKVLEHARPGATFLLNSPFGPDEVWDHLPVEVQEQIVTKDIALWVVDAEAIARAAGMGNRINTVMQPCFFSLSGRAAGRRGRRAHQGLGGQGLRQAGPERRRPQLRRHRRVARRAGPGARCPPR